MKKRTPKNASPNEQTLVILRHAHRDTSQSSALDNGLSEKGLEQAKKIKKYYEKNFSDYPTVVLSSPKRRCLETVKKLAKAADVEVIVSPALDEGGDLLGKTLELLHELSDIPAELVVLCSHGDVIPVLTHQLIGTEILLDKGGWIQLERVAGRYHLQWVLQDLSTKID